MYQRKKRRKVQAQPAALSSTHHNCYQQLRIIPFEDSPMIAEYQNKFNSAIVETLLDMDAMSQASLERLVNVTGQNQYDRRVITTDPATSVMPMRISIPRRYSRATGKRYTMLPCFLLPHYQY